MPDQATRLTLLYTGKAPVYVNSQAAFHLASERAAEGATVSFLCLAKGRLWTERQALRFEISHLLGSKLLCTYRFPKLGAGGVGLLRRLLRGQNPSRLVIDHLGLLVAGSHKKADSYALTQIRKVLAGHGVEVIVVHDVNFYKAVDFLEDGFVDEIVEAEIPHAYREVPSDDG